MTSVLECEMDAPQSPRNTLHSLLSQSQKTISESVRTRQLTHQIQASRAILLSHLHETREVKSLATELSNTLRHQTALRLENSQLRQRLSQQQAQIAGQRKRKYYEP